MTAPTPATFAEKLARTIHDDVASPLLRAKERLRVFGDLKVTPSISVDPQTGGVSFSFDVGERREDIHATIERLLELPGELAADRKRQVVLVLDEFQEVVEIDRRLPNLMRAVFQRQPEVAHVYLGSKRHMMQRIFNDENEPFWRSAKQVELGVIEPRAVRRLHQAPVRAHRPLHRGRGGRRDPRPRPAATPTRPRSSATSPGRRRRPTSAPRPSTSRPR